MSFKKILSNTRGEAASLVILVSMIVITVGILTGSRVLQNRIKTSSKASTSTISCANLVRSPNTSDFVLEVTAATSPNPFYAILQYNNQTILQGVSDNATTITFAVPNPQAGTYKAFVATTSNGYYKGSDTCIYTYSGDTLSPTLTPTPLPYTLSGYVRFNNGIGAEGVNVKLYIYGTGTNPPRTFHSQTTTDSDGKYQFNLLPGTYDVEPQSITALPIAPTMQTMELMASPYTVTVPLFTASGSPTSTPTHTPKSTLTPTITSTITPTEILTVTPIATLTSTVTVTLTPSITITGTAPSVTVTISPTVSPTTSITPSVSPEPTTITMPPSPIPSISQNPVFCAKKKYGDADCKQDPLKRSINIFDYAIWYSEFVKDCSAEKISNCGVDADGDGNLMDANFNYPGTNYIQTDTKVSVFDYAVWIQGFTADNQQSITPTKPISPILPSVTVSISPIMGQNSIWISPQEIKARPTSGPEWDAMLALANKAKSQGANIANQDSNHDIETLAMTLVCVRQGEPGMCAKARAAVVGAIGTEEGGRWLAVGRNLGAYIISADLLNLYTDGNPNSDGSKVNAWLNKFYTRTLQANNDAKIQHQWRQSAWASGSNASAQEGFAYAALSAYLKKKDGLDWSWMAFRRYAGDRSSTHTITSNDTSWQFKPTDIVGIQDAGATKNGCRLDGAIANDMSRGGTYSCTPGFTQYPWVGLEGAVPAALVLQRSGYPAFSIADNAILRTHEYLWDLRQRTGNTEWFDGTRANEVIHLVNIAYKKNFLIKTPITGGARTVDFTSWTHPSGL